ncbi:MAG: TIGR04255 family protein [Chloroflexi bacterium]|nr:TIGR04255 family protein [Chloroflexota bacterium]
MARQRHLKNAPITEALIDFRVSLPTDFNITSFSNLEKDLSGKYPNKKPLRLITGKIGIEAGKHINVTEDKGIQGYAYESEDGKNIAQFRADGFTHNRLEPYTSWDEVIGEAKFLWNVYKKVARPRLITRIAVRYLNRLNIPANLGEYITNPPKLPDGVPETVSSFLTRIVIQDSDRGVAANITEALEKSVEPNCLMVILDIDVYKQHDFGVDDENVWNTFTQMRELKNLIFFNTITEKTAERYE